MNVTVKAALIDTYLAKREDLRRFLAARFGNEDHAEDIVQDMFFRLQRMTFAEAIQNPTAFLYKVAFNLARDRRREHQRRFARDRQWVDANVKKLGPEVVSDLPPAEESYDAKRRLARIIAALGDLPPRCREVFVLHKLDGLTHREVAARLGISRGMVEKHMSRALKHLLQIRDEGDITS